MSGHDATFASAEDFDISYLADIKAEQKENRFSLSQI